MIKNTVIALATIAALAGIAAPAMAAGSLASSPSDNGFDQDYVLAQLQHKGIDASSVEEWGDYLVALVTEDGGKQTMVYLTPVTLDVVNL
ncbi:PepSY domain-containing protein [Devosia sp. CAU 1758]